MKNQYETLEMSVVLFDNEDIVTTSSVIDYVGSGNEDNDLAFDMLNK